MSIQGFINSLSSAVVKIKDCVDREASGETSTIIHPEVFRTEAEAKIADEDASYRAFYSSKKEFARRTKGF